MPIQSDGLHDSVGEDELQFFAVEGGTLLVDDAMEGGTDDDDVVRVVVEAAGKIVYVVRLDHEGRVAFLHPSKWSNSTTLGITCCFAKGQ